MKDLIVFASKHHGNTRKLVQAIKANIESVDIVDASITQYLDLSKYDRICFASGICYGQYYPEIISFIENNSLEGHSVLLIHSAGSPKEAQCERVKKLIALKGGNCVKVFCCKGYDTYGPFKLIGGISKNHPNNDDIAKAIAFFRS